MKKRSRLWHILGRIVLITIGFIVLQSLMEKLSRTIYRTVFKSEEIDFDNLEPEIVLKDKEK